MRRRLENLAADATQITSLISERLVVDKTFIRLVGEVDDFTGRTDNIWGCLI